MYREEVHHAALPLPIVAAGEMWLGADGRLMRRQTRPELELSAIGRDIVTVTSGTGDNILPIPSEMRPVLGLLRALAQGDTPDLPGATMVTTPAGWRVTGTAQGMVLGVFGCGAVLGGVEIVPDAGPRRRILFGAGP